MSWWNRLQNLWRREELSEELEEEFEFHIEARTRDNRNAGMSAEAARVDARRRFGNRTLAQESAHKMNIIVPIETVGQDLRYAARSLRRSPGFTTLAVLATALGIGANAAVFAVVNGVLLRPLPFSRPDSLFLVSYRQTLEPWGPGLSDQQYLGFRQATHLFDGVATVGEDFTTLTGVGEAVRLPVADVTASFFSVLGVHPFLGRAFLPEEEQANGAVAILSESLWRDRFHSDPAILGKSIRLDGTARTVIGVMGPGFHFPNDPAIWLPLQVTAGPGNSYFRIVFGRLRPSATPQQALAELEAFVAHLPITWPHPESMRAEILPLKDLLVSDIRRSLVVFMGAVCFVLLIACANVANLLLMRGSLRRQEMAVRTALGAHRRRLIRQLLTESGLISLAGAVGGVLLSLIAVRSLVALAPAGEIPRIEEVHLDMPVLAFALALALLTGIVFGLLPAFHCTGHELSSFLGHGGRALTARRERLRGALVVSEIALALVLLTGAGLMIKSFVRMRSVDPGFRSEHILTMSVDLPESLYHNAPDMRAFHARILEKLAALPSVKSAGMVNWLPLKPDLVMGDFHLEDGRRLPPDYVVVKPAVSPDYFRVMGIRLRNGRFFSPQDSAKAPSVAVISQNVARTFWPDSNPIGRRLTLEDNPQPQDWLTIVGVVDDVSQHSLTEKPSAAIYQPYTQVTRPFFLEHMAFAVRTAGKPDALAPAMRAAVQDVDRDQPVQSIAAMTDLVNASTAESAFQTRLIGIFSLLALLLSAVGIYGMLACAVTERTREIGIRMALGADRSEITRMVLRRSMLLVAIGIPLGVAGALLLTRVLARFLYGVRSYDPATFALMAALLAVVALTSSILPARRATRVDPMLPLRSD